MEDDSFRSRVDRAFSLLLPQQQQHSIACAASAHQYWTVSAQQQSDKKKWNNKNKKREDDDAPFCHEGDNNLLKLRGGSDGGVMHHLSDSPELLGNGIWAPTSRDDGFEDDEVDEQEKILQYQGKKDGDGDGDEDEDEDEGDELKRLRMGIGVDETVDLEDEEDEYDRAAVGQEEDGDRVFMKFINSYDLHKDKLSSFHAPTIASRVPQRDFRADHAAAAARLAEDDVEARASNMNDLFQPVTEVQPSNNGKGSTFTTENHVSWTALNWSEQAVDMDTEATGLTVHPDLSYHLDVMKMHFLKDRFAGSQSVEITEQCFLEKNTGSGHVVSTLYSGRSDEPDMDLQGTDCSSGFSTLKEIPGIQASTPGHSNVPDHVQHPWRYQHCTLDGPDYADEQCDMEAFPDYEGLNSTDPTRKLIRFIPRSKHLLHNDAGKSGNSIPRLGNNAFWYYQPVGSQRRLGNNGSTDVQMHQVSSQSISGIARSMQSQDGSGLSESISDTEESLKTELSTIQRRYRSREFKSGIPE